MAASSSAALRRTSSTIACSSAMASPVAVCRAFTAWGQGGLSLVGARSQSPAPARRAPRAHQHRLLQPLAALHVRRLEVHAVSPALPTGSPRMSPAPGHPPAPSPPAPSTHPCMSRKQRMHSSDFLSVENMM